MFLGGDLAVQLVAVCFFLFEEFVPPPFETFEPTVQVADLSPVQPQSFSGKPLQKPPVMADQDQSGSQVAKFFLQPLDGGQVQVIGGFVQQQNVGLGRQNPGQGAAAGLTAGQGGRVLAAVEAQMVEQGEGAACGPAVVQGRRHICQCGGKTRQVRLLVKVADRGALADGALAAVRLDKPGGDFQHRGFPRPVSAHQAQSIPGRDGKIRPFEQRRPAESHANVLQNDQRCRHARAPARRSNLQGAAVQPQPIPVLAIAGVQGFDAAPKPE